MENPEIAYEEFKVEVQHPALDPMKRNSALEAAALGNMKELGIVIDNDDGRRGSSDMDNLSHYLPAIHSYLPLWRLKSQAIPPIFAMQPQAPEVAGHCSMPPGCWP